MAGKTLWRAMGIAALLSMTNPVLAQEKTGSRAGFTLPPGSVRVVLMRPNIRVGEQSTGGLGEPNADWTNTARANISEALRAVQAGLGNSVVEYDEGMSGEGGVMTQYSQLFSAVAGSVITYQFFPGNRLPTKKRKGSFDWSIGTDVGKLRSLEGADYALFITTNDQFGSTGRKVLQVFAMMGGISVTSGVHAGYAGLVDLRSGELVWLNADQQMGGDVRTAEGAAKRVKQLLEGFPGKPVETAAAGGGQ
ncbi:hypothetical protein [Sphingomonas sp. ID0503]|uniref:hypothetical protein n=1 Tax=Sphingomonas sp. ID0503 TaxID=3399691 RepID=UPI003AFAD666